MRTIVCVNTLNNVHFWAYASHCEEWHRMGKAFPNEDFVLYTPGRTSIDQARNSAVRMALEMEADYVYFIDDDMILTSGTYSSLRKADKDIVMAASIVRGYPFNVMFFVAPKDPLFELSEVDHIEHFNNYEEYINDVGLVRVDAIGCAAVLYKAKLFKDLQPPYFVTLPNMTEDVYCCLRLTKQYGRKNLNIYVDTNVPTGHILYPEVVYPSNRKKLLVRAKEDLGLPIFDEDKPNNDRGKKYAEDVESSFNPVASVQD